MVEIGEKMAIWRNIEVPSKIFTWGPQAEKPIEKSTQRSEIEKPNTKPK